MSILSIFRRDNPVQKLEEKTACVESGFPICLSEGLLTMFGAKGKGFLDAIARREGFEHPQIASQKDICDLYASYMKCLTNVLGESPTQVVKFESFKVMQSMLCTSCPLYEDELRRRKLSSGD